MPSVGLSGEGEVVQAGDTEAGVVDAAAKVPSGELPPRGPTFWE